MNRVGGSDNIRNDGNKIRNLLNKGDPFIKKDFTVLVIIILFIISRYYLLNIWNPDNPIILLEKRGIDVSSIEFVEITNEEGEKSIFIIFSTTHRKRKNM